jgi:hypothetical protein
MNTLIVFVTLLVVVVNSTAVESGGSFEGSPGSKQMLREGMDASAALTQANTEAAVEVVDPFY